jgi:Fibronectin type III domain
MATTTWDALFKGRSDLVRKALYGSVLVQDYSAAAAQAFASWAPFDADTGLLNALSTNWVDLGYLTEDGIEFGKSTDFADTTGWQTRDRLRSDATSDQDTATMTFLETKPQIEAIYNSLPLSSMPDIGATNYSYAKPAVPALLFRSLLFIGVDGAGDQVEYVVRLWPRCLMNGPDNYSWNASSEASWPMAFTPYPDSNAGFAVKTWRDGPGHRAHGPVILTGAPSVGTITSTSVVVNWAAATASGGTSPYTYQVYTNGVLSNVNNATGTSGTVSGLTTGTNYSFVVKAKDSANHQSGPSTAVTARTS